MNSFPKLPDNDFNTAIRKKGRDILYSNLMKEVNKHGSLTLYDKFFIVGLVRHKIAELHRNGDK